MSNNDGSPEKVLKMKKTTVLTGNFPKTRDRAKSENEESKSFLFNNDNKSSVLAVGS